MQAVRTAVFSVMAGGVGFCVYQYFGGRFHVPPDSYGLVVRNGVLKPHAYGPGYHHCLPVMGEKAVLIDAAPVPCTTLIDGPLGPIPLSMRASYTASLDLAGVVPLYRALGKDAINPAIARDAVARAAGEQLNYAAALVASYRPGPAAPSRRGRGAVRKMSRGSQGKVVHDLAATYATQATDHTAGSVEDQLARAKLVALFAQCVERAANPRNSRVAISDLALVPETQE
ncbi:uncharacterized protein AMSG_02762 [Thecamonas trahens ATCC 50062]|uniref:Band 7 domain-containing protein n=1 Tax=Thecamonas trahens ATCC 50062 TaxID=461836 RepID=A0A0L0D283_THETB|nr:hypothetical protein AMSG_02762 [Thecamonas trahens ATCC 50062]KNC46311.1 hypothetical protein AMSG_02762 [Thecamonas trahens ATCC 50062]|eukprot:XP_013760604.1 hypothetical protein AMSG_02762 [Thecamonas trahens ATCC 50062]